MQPILRTTILQFLDVSQEEDEDIEAYASLQRKALLVYLFFCRAECPAIQLHVRLLTHHYATEPR